jgi:thiamine pyrophosphate-dependent acetolactate synthase large subunit-like protein
MLKAAWGDAPIGSKVIRVSADAHSHRGWSMDYQGLPPSDVYMMCEPDVAVPLLVDAVRPRPAVVAPKPQPEQQEDEAVSIRALARAFNELTSGMDVCISKLPLGWNGSYRHFKHPMDYLGADGGGGVGAGPGLTVGAALALKDTKRMVAGIMGDGDFLMGVTAVWTATHYKVPCLMIVANNRSFYNDELHQERVAKERGRPVENKWIGQRIDEPDIDIAMMARAQGAVGIGPVKRIEDLRPSVEEAIKQVKAGAVCVVDVRVMPGYDIAANPPPAAASRR